MNEVLYALVFTVCLGAGEDKACEDFMLDYNLTAADCHQRQEQVRAKLDVTLDGNLWCIEIHEHDWVDPRDSQDLQASTGDTYTPQGRE
jgi:hypothetical protein